MPHTLGPNLTAHRSLLVVCMLNFLSLFSATPVAPCHITLDYALTCGIFINTACSCLFPFAHTLPGHLLSLLFCYHILSCCCYLPRGFTAPLPPHRPSHTLLLTRGFWMLHRSTAFLNRAPPCAFPGTCTLTAIHNTTHAPLPPAVLLPTVTLLPALLRHIRTHTRGGGSYGRWQPTKPVTCCWLRFLYHTTLDPLLRPTVHYTVLCVLPGCTPFQGLNLLRMPLLTRLDTFRFVLVEPLHLFPIGLYILPTTTTTATTACHHLPPVPFFHYYLPRTWIFSFTLPMVSVVPAQSFLIGGWFVACVCRSCA